MKPQSIGNIAVTKVVETIMPFDPVAGLPDCDPAAFTANMGWLAPHFFDPASFMMLFSMHSFVVRTARHTILIDTCIGNHKDRPMIPFWNQRSGPYLDFMRDGGVAPESIDYVMCTHLHADHIGWNTRLENGRWVPTFPNARYVFSRADYEAASRLRPGERGYQPYADSVLPVVEAKQAAIVGSDFALDDEVSILPTPGHTPGHYCVNLSSRGERGVMTGDLIHHPMQILYPEWVTSFCADPVAGRAQRIKFVDDHTDSGATIFAAHFGGPTAGKIMSAPSGRRFVLNDPDHRHG